MTKYTHDRPERGQKKGAAMPPRVTDNLTQSSGLYIYHGCVTSLCRFPAGGRPACERFRRLGEWIISSSPKCSGTSLAGDAGRLTCFSSITYPSVVFASGWLTTYKRERRTVVMRWLTPVNNVRVVTFHIPRPDKYYLPAFAGGRYISPAGDNPPAGRRNPFNEQKATQTRPASFFVSCHRTTIPSGKARTVSMVALVGQPKGWPVSFCAGIPTPASVTAPCECRNSGGDSLNLQKEAARMATIPTTSHPEFTFHFLAVRRSDLNDRPHRESVNAPNETTARRMLARDFVLLFAGRVPAQEVRHV